jgi:hypothetical protein
MSVTEGMIMIEYRIIKAGSEAEVARDVKNAIKEGWRPQGGVSVAKSLFPIFFPSLLWAQAVVRDTK